MYGVLVLLITTTSIATATSTGNFTYFFIVIYICVSKDCLINESFYFLLLNDFSVFLQITKSKTL